MICFPNAKINLGLNIIEKRNDGFHNIESIFYPIQLCDILEVIEKQGKGVEFSSSGISIPCNESENICVKAYNLISKDYHLPGIKMHLHKIIPIGAGLGGGSSDAAFFIKLLNEQFGLWIPWGEIYDYAYKLGSDCSFFISNKPSFVFERGDVFENVNFDLRGYHIALVFPNIHIATKAAYEGIFSRHPHTNLRQDIFLPIEKWKENIKNDFEDFVYQKFPEVKKIKEQLYSLGAVYASMSGSGSSVYGIFEKKKNVKKKISNYFVWEGEM